MKRSTVHCHSSLYLHNSKNVPIIQIQVVSMVPQGEISFGAHKKTLLVKEDPKKSLKSSIMIDKFRCKNRRKQDFRTQL